MKAFTRFPVLPILSASALLTSTAILNDGLSIGIIISSDPSIMSVTLQASSQVPSLSSSTVSPADATSTVTSSGTVNGFSTIGGSAPPTSNAINGTSMIYGSAPLASTSTKSVSSTSSSTEMSNVPASSIFIGSSTSDTVFSASTVFSPLLSSSIVVTSATANTLQAPSSVATDSSFGAPLASMNLTAPRASSTGRVHIVQVGLNSTLTFQPPTVAADVGDTLDFRFRAFNHTLTECSLESPCVPLDGGFSSGFNQYNPTDTDRLSVSFTVNSPDPRYFFCEQIAPVAHCLVGMVFALNAGPEYATFASNVLEIGPISSLVTSLSAETLTVTSGQSAETTILSNVTVPKYALNQTTPVLPIVTLPTVRGPDSAANTETGYVRARSLPYSNEGSPATPQGLAFLSMLLIQIVLSAMVFRNA